MADVVTALSLPHILTHSRADFQTEHTHTATYTVLVVLHMYVYLYLYFVCSIYMIDCGFVF